MLVAVLVAFKLFDLSGGIYAFSTCQNFNVNSGIDRCLLVSFIGLLYIFLVITVGVGTNGLYAVRAGAGDLRLVIGVDYLYYYRVCGPAVLVVDAGALAIFS